MEIMKWSYHFRKSRIGSNQLCTHHKTSQFQNTYPPFLLPSMYQVAACSPCLSAPADQPDTPMQKLLDNKPQQALLLLILNLLILSSFLRIHADLNNRWPLALYPYQGYVNNMLISYEKPRCLQFPYYHIFVCSVWILATEIPLSTGFQGVTLQNANFHMTISGSR